MIIFVFVNNIKILLYRWVDKEQYKYDCIRYLSTSLRYFLSIILDVWSVVVNNINR